MAAQAEGAGNYDKAAAIYASLLNQASDPQSQAHVRTRLATAYYMLHRYRDSLDVIGGFTPDQLQQAPAQAWVVQGLDELGLDQPARAIEPLRRALIKAPESGTARLALGDALARTGDLAGAASEYEEQTRRTPAVADAWYKVGLAYDQLAITMARDYAEKFPDSAIGQQLRGETLLEKGDALNGATVLLHVIRQSPDQPFAHSELGAALLELGYTNAAEDQFREELKHNPFSPEARWGLVEIALLRNDWVSANAERDRVMRDSPRQLSMLLSMPPPGPLRTAWVGGEIKMPASEGAASESSLWSQWLGGNALDVNSVSVKRTAGALCDGTLSDRLQPGVWQPEGCYRELQLRLSQKGPMSPAERAKLAEADYRLGYYPAARQEAARALRSNAEHGWSTYWLSHSYSQLATQAFLKVTSLNPNSARVHELLAQYYANHFDFAHAKSEYAAALRIEPELPDLHLGLGSIHWALGEWSDAERELRTTLQLSPGSTTARYELGDSLVKQNRWQDALDPLREAAADPKFAVKARMDLAVAEEQSGRVAQAISDLEPAAEDDPTGDVHFLLARLYRKAGDAASARKAQLEFLRLRNAGNASQRAELEALDKR